MNLTTYFKFPNISADLGDCLEAILNLALFAQEQSGIVEPNQEAEKVESVDD